MPWAEICRHIFSIGPTFLPGKSKGKTYLGAKSNSDLGRNLNSCLTAASTVGGGFAKYKRGSNRLLAIPAQFIS